MSADLLDSNPGRLRRLVLGLVIWAAAYALVVHRFAPPAVRPAASTAVTEFSAERALQTLERLLGDSQPHPLGTLAGVALRSQLLLELRGLGLFVDEQADPVCGPYAVCGTPVNVLARLDPPRSLPQSGDTILLACHHDSVAAGAGVADDLMGVATLLECARALTESGDVPRPVIFLFTDGEEQGLLGAQAFVDLHPWRDEIGVTLNVEARGTSGPSLLFETGPDNGWLIEAFADACAHAVTTSLYYEAYRRLPNDTDFSVFKDAGHTGLNFANIEGVRHYHTPLDSLANFDVGSLQDHGDHVLGMTRALLTADIVNPPIGDAVYTHVLGAGMMVWSVNVGRALALFVLIWLGFAVRRARGAGVSRKRVVLAMLLLPTAIVTAVVAEGIAAAIAGALGATGFTPLSAWLVRALFWLVGLTSTAWVAGRFRASAGDAALALGTWLAWALFALFTALVVPGVSYLLLLPAGVLAVGALFFPIKDGARPRALPHLVGFAVAAMLWSDLQHGLEQGFGVLASTAHALPLATIGTLLAPVAPRAGRALLGAVFAAVVALLAALAIVPAYDANGPAHLNVIVTHDADEDVSRMHVRAGGVSLPAELAALAEFAAPSASYPWAPHAHSYQAPEPAASPAAPRFEVLESGQGEANRLVRGRLFSPAGAWRTQVRIRAAEERRFGVTLGGRALFTGFGEDRDGELVSATFHAIPPEGLEITIHLPGDAPLEVFVIDTHLDLPPAARAVADARPSHCVPVGTGDRTLVFVRQSL